MTQSQIEWLLIIILLSILGIWAAIPLPAIAAGSSTYQVSAYPDDATGFGGGISYDDQLDINDQATLAARFIIGVPFGSSISAAQIDLIPLIDGTACSAMLRLEDTTNALNFESGPPLDQRQYFAPVAASIPASSADEAIQIDADIATALTALVGQPGYIPYQSSIALTIGPCANEAEAGAFYSYDLAPANAPRLIVEYTAPTSIDYNIQLPSGRVATVSRLITAGDQLITQLLIAIAAILTFRLILRIIDGSRASS